MSVPVKKKSKKKRNLLQLFWYYLKEDEGPIGWILNIIIAFIVIKYLLIPGLGWLLGTGFPLVAVVSGSMEHGGDLNQWWDIKCTSPTGQKTQSELYVKYSIVKEDFKDFRFTNGLDTGDLMLLKGADSVMIGDVIVFNANTKYDPIIHRVVGIKEVDGQRAYTTKGDANCGSSRFELSISKSQIVGKSWLRIPLLGYVKLYFEKLLRFVGLESVIAVFR